MVKVLELGLNAFPQIPAGLRANGKPPACATEIRVNLAHVFHHRFVDNHPSAPPPYSILKRFYGGMFTDRIRLRATGDGPASHKEARISDSMQWGKAFCRWFLHEHCQINYFTHMDDILGKGLGHQFGPIQLKRVRKGDTPDYVCTRDRREFFLAEAKGRSSVINFASEDFNKWRRQFTRVECRDHQDQPLKVKGYIVATRIVNETHPSTDRSTLLAEDPDTAGESAVNPQQSGDAGDTVLSHHYGNVFRTLRLSLYAEALRTAVQIPTDVKVRVGIWECLLPPARGVKFVGGYFLPGENGRDRWFHHLEDPRLCLSAGEAYFFGVEKNVFDSVMGIVREGRSMAARVEVYRAKSDLTSEISVLRDGTIFGNLDFFRLLDVVEI